MKGLEGDNRDYKIEWVEIDVHSVHQSLDKVFDKKWLGNRTVTELAKTENGYVVKVEYSITKAMNLKEKVSSSGKNEPLSSGELS